jgi:hypothetical protein
VCHPAKHAFEFPLTTAALFFSTSDSNIAAALRCLFVRVKYNAARGMTAHDHTTATTVQHIPQTYPRVGLKAGASASGKKICWPIVSAALRRCLGLARWYLYERASSALSLSAAQIWCDVEWSGSGEIGTHYPNTVIVPVAAARRCLSPPQLLFSHALMIGPMV